MGDSYYYGDGSGLGALAFFLLIFPILLIIAAASYVIGSFLLMKVFEKAGVEGKWRAWVPFYNSLIMAKLGDLSPWVYLIATIASGVLVNIPIIGWIIALAGFAVSLMSAYRLGLKFGRDWPYLLLWLIPGVGIFVWLGILAFGSTPWNPNIPRSPWATTFLADKTYWNGIPVQPDQQLQTPPAAAGYAAPTGTYTPPAQPFTPPPTPPAAGTTPPPPAPPAGPTPPPAGPQA